MNYEQKYKQLHKFISDLYPYMSEYCKEKVEGFFPELKESENERTRKELIDFVKSRLAGFPQCKKYIAWLDKQGEQKEYTFKSLPRLLNMIEPTSKAKAYCQKLIDSLVKEGYYTDAKIVGECIKKMNGEKVSLATMDENQGEQNEDATKDKVVKHLKNLITDQSLRGAPMLYYEGRIEAEADLIIRIAKKELKK